MTQVSERLVRLLNMVPYFQAHPPQISHEEAAAELGVTRKQLLADLNQLWMCGCRAAARVISSTSTSMGTTSR